MDLEIIEWYWQCINERDSRALEGFFKAQGYFRATTLFNAHGLNGLHVASSDGNLDVVKLLVHKNKIDIDSVAKMTHWTALHFACSNSQIEVVRFLLESNASSTICSVDHALAYDVGTLTVRAFIDDFQQSQSVRGRLSSLCQSEKVDIEDWKLFLQDNPYFNLNCSCNTSGWSPLFFVAYYGQLEVTRLMLEYYNVDVHLRDNSRRTALHWACADNHIDIIEVLLEFGADIDAQDSSGFTILMQAVVGKNKVLVQKLLKHYPNVELRNEMGYTVLALCDDADIKEVLHDYQVSTKDTSDLATNSCEDLEHENLEGDIEVQHQTLHIQTDRLDARESNADEDMEASPLIQALRHALPSPDFRVYDASIFERFEKSPDRFSISKTDMKSYITETIQEIQSELMDLFDSDTLDEHHVNLYSFLISFLIADDHVADGLFRDQQCTSSDSNNDFKEILSNLLMLIGNGDAQSIVAMNSVMKQVSDLHLMVNSTPCLILDGLNQIKAELQKFHRETESTKQDFQDKIEALSKTIRVQSSMLHSILRNNHVMPGLFIIVPQAPGSWHNFNPKNWVYKRFSLFFVCPITLKVAASGADGNGYVFDVAQKWVKFIAPAVTLGLILLKASLACSGIPLPTPFVNLGEIGALEYVDNILKHVGTLDNSIARVCNAAASMVGQTVSSRDISNLVGETFMYEHGKAISNGLAEVKVLLERKKLDSFPCPRHTGLQYVIAKDGSSGWVHPSVAQDFFVKGNEV